MKVRTYVFAFVPIPAEWIPHPATVRGFNGGPNGSSLTDRTHNERLRWRGRHRRERDTQSLPSHLFWTWFVDNPRPSCF
jgi:hypothetical protein